MVSKNQLPEASSPKKVIAVTKAPTPSTMLPARRIPLPILALSLRFSSRVGSGLTVDRRELVVLDCTGRPVTVVRGPV